MSKLLSIIIPLYNSAQWLPKCLNSALCQDVDEEQLEIICVNDGSPDNSADIVRQYQARHPQSIVLLEQENQGTSGARNNGMRHATGKYLCFLDPDDFLQPNVLGVLTKRMEEEQLDMLRFNYQIVDENYNHIEKRQFEKDFDYSSQLMTGAEFLANRLDIACHIWKYMYRTETITKKGIWCFTGDYFDDTPWLPMVLMNAKRMDICNTVVHNYQERSDSLVKAKTLKAVRRQNDGFILLLRLLKEEMCVLQGGESHRENMRALATLAIPDETLEKILQWYNMIIAHATVALLTNVAVKDYQSCESVINQVKELGINHLSSHNALTINKRKINLYNLSPYLLYKAIRLKHKMYKAY